MSKAMRFVVVGNVRMKKNRSTLLDQFDSYSLFSDTNVCDTYFLLRSHCTYYVYRQILHSHCLLYQCRSNGKTPWKYPLVTSRSHYRWVTQHSRWHIDVTLVTLGL